MAFSLPAAAEVTLLSQNFEGLQLKNATSPTETAAEKVWTDVFPSGWGRDNGTTPVGNPVEFFGWTMADKQWWITTEGNQERSQFTKGLGTVMVADPDAYDDGTNIDTGLFASYAMSPAIDLTSVAANSVKVSFDSSWRNEETQDGLLQVSYNGGAFETLLTYDSSDPVFTSETIFVNESLSFNLNNPSGGSMMLRWGMVDASNDWWWAVDNVKVTGELVPEPSTGIMAGVLALLCACGFRRKLR